MKQNIKQIIGVKDTLGRLGNVVVMVITTINTATLTVTKYVNKEYYEASVYLGLLVLLHIPAIIVLSLGVIVVTVQKTRRFVRARREKPKSDVESGDPNRNPDTNEEDQDPVNDEAGVVYIVENCPAVATDAPMETIIVTEEREGCDDLESSAEVVLDFQLFSKEESKSKSCSDENLNKEKNAKSSTEEDSSKCDDGGADVEMASTDLQLFPKESSDPKSCSEVKTNKKEDPETSVKKDSTCVEGCTDTISSSGAVVDSHSKENSAVESCSKECTTEEKSAESASKNGSKCEEGCENLETSSEVVLDLPLSSKGISNSEGNSKESSVEKEKDKSSDVKDGKSGDNNRSEPRLLSKGKSSSEGRSEITSNKKIKELSKDSKFVKSSTKSMEKEKDKSSDVKDGKSGDNNRSELGLLLKEKSSSEGRSEIMSNKKINELSKDPKFVKSGTKSSKEQKQLNDKSSKGKTEPGASLLENVKQGKTIDKKGKNSTMWTESEITPKRKALNKAADLGRNIASGGKSDSPGLDVLNDSLSSLTSLSKNKSSSLF